MKLLHRLENKTAYSVGVIRFGDGLNVQHWVSKARSSGYTVRYVDGGAMLYR